MARKTKPPAGKSVDALRHQEASRRNIPTAEYQSVIAATRLPSTGRDDSRRLLADPERHWRPGKPAFECACRPRGSVLASPSC